MDDNSVIALINSVHVSEKHILEEENFFLNFCVTVSFSNKGYRLVYSITESPGQTAAASCVLSIDAMTHVACWVLKLTFLKLPPTSIWSG